MVLSTLTPPTAYDGCVSSTRASWTGSEAPFGPCFPDAPRTGCPARGGRGWNLGPTPDPHLRRTVVLSTVYTSSATYPFTDDDLAVLLLNSRANNARAGLTGVLLHQDGQFMQVLEGPDDAVRERYAIIASDPRHGAVQLVAQESIAERRFPAWTMGYRAVVDTGADDLPGFDDFFSAPAAGRTSETAARVQDLVAQLGDEDPTAA
ncbi:hypothetical protein DEI92_07215 [Curtobacterium sp. MCBD17_034]|nr:hypothetical protein DEI92_07215 [Curtobacterium sp. MCBD17_034]PZM34842.1 hypothetical protein DEI90_05200 [Curtobacterium sp. MCBD17_031]